jgi:protein disulfide-isomerase
MGGFWLFNADAKDNLHWLDDGKVAFAQAKKENKLVLLDFTGSTWCPACIAMHKEVFSTPKFEEYAKKYVLLRVDFPDPISVPRKGAPLVHTYLGEEVALPTVMILSADGKKLGTVDYREGGPDAFIGAAEKIAKAKPHS